MEEKLAWAANNATQSIAVLAIMVACVEGAMRLRRWRKKARKGRQKKREAKAAEAEVEGVKE